MVTSVIYQPGDPYEKILSDPNFRPKPEEQPNKTIDQLITSAYGGLPSKQTMHKSISLPLAGSHKPTQQHTIPYNMLLLTSDVRTVQKQLFIFRS